MLAVDAAVDPRGDHGAPGGLGRAVRRREVDVEHAPLLDAGQLLEESVGQAQAAHGRREPPLDLGGQQLVGRVDVRDTEDLDVVVAHPVAPCAPRTASNAR